VETISLVIMALGLIALGAIYFISRASKKDLPTDKKLPPINTLMDQNGEEATSIMEDQPARDGKGPSSNAQDLSDVVDEKAAAKKKSNPNLPPQLIMFVASETDEGFQGPEIIEALENSGLTFGEMDVYHRMVLSGSGECSLFNVANGVKPWTLIPEQLAEGVSTPEAFQQSRMEYQIAQMGDAMCRPSESLDIREQGLEMLAGWYKLGAMPAEAKHQQQARIDVVRQAIAK